MKAADIHIKMNVALIKVRRTGFPYFRVRIYSFQFKPYLLTDTIALNSVLYKKQVKAYTYILNQEKYLRVFLEDGEVPIDNNASERAIRGFCIGKKNWQMIDTINGAHSSAIIYSIAETAKANSLKPYDYFVYLLEEIPKHMDQEDRTFLEDLLPWSEKLPEEIRKQP